MNTRVSRCAAGLVAVLALAAAARAEGPEMTYLEGPARNGLSDDQRKQVVGYVRYWVDALATAKDDKRVKDARTNLTQGYNKYGTRADAHQSAYAEAMAGEGKALFGGKIAAGDPLAGLKQINFAVTVLRMGRPALQPLTEAMVSHKASPVRYCGWQAYATLRGPVIAEGGKPLDTLYATLDKAAGQETDSQVLRQLTEMFRLNKPDPALGVSDDDYRMALERLVKVLQRHWTGLCRKVQTGEAVLAEATFTALAGLRGAVSGLGDDADKKATLQMVLNLTWCSGQAFARAAELMEAAQQAQQATTGDELGAPDPLALQQVKQLAAKFGMTMEELASQSGPAQHAASANQFVLTTCEEMLNELSGRQVPGERWLRKPMAAARAPGGKGPAVLAGVEKWVDTLVREQALKRPEALFPAASQPTTTTAPAGG